MLHHVHHFVARSALLAAPDPLGLSRTDRDPYPDDVTMATGWRRLVPSRWPNLLIEDGGPTQSGRIAPATAIPTPSPTAHLAGHAGDSRYVVSRPSLSPSAHRREVGRNLALDLTGAVGCRRQPRARGVAAADDRTSRRPGSHRPRGPRRCAVHREPPGGVRRPRRATFRAPDGGDPHRRCGVAAVAVRPPHPTRHGRGRDRLLGQPVDEQPVPAPTLGRHVSGPPARSDRRVAGHGSLRRDGDRLTRRRDHRRPDRRAGGDRPRGPRWRGLRDRLHGSARAGRRRTAPLHGPRLHPFDPRPPGPGTDHAGPGVLRRWADRGHPAICPRLRRSPRPQPRRRRPDRRPRRRLDDRVVPPAGARSSIAPDPSWPCGWGRCSGSPPS